MFLPLRPTPEAIEALGKLEEEVASKMVNSCVHAIIVLGQRQNPIKKQDLNKLAFPPSTYYKIAGYVVQQANKMLQKNFGMRLYELEDKTKYLLVNADSEHNMFLELPDNNFETTLLFFILADIFASPEDRINEEDFYKNIKPLEIPKDTVKEILETLVKKLYIQLEKRQELRTYSWGPRAIAEVEPENFFSHFLEMVGDNSDKKWPDLRKKVDNLKSLRNV